VRSLAVICIQRDVQWHEKTRQTAQLKTARWPGGPGLRGVRLVISNAHEGLKNAIAAVLDGAIWQRCRTHFMRNLLSRGAPIRQAVVATLVRSTFAQPDAAST
jgi:hypothetical protein